MAASLPNPVVVSEHFLFGIVILGGLGLEYQVLMTVIHRVRSEMCVILLSPSKECFHTERCSCHLPSFYVVLCRTLLW